MKYVFIPEQTLSQFKINKDHCLTPDEVVDIIVNKKLIKKLILQRCFAIQEDIGMGKHRGNDETFHMVVDELGNIVNFIESMEKKYNEYEENENKQKSENK